MTSGRYSIDKLSKFQDIMSLVSKLYAFSRQTKQKKSRFEPVTISFTSHSQQLQIILIIISVTYSIDTQKQVINRTLEMHILFKQLH